MPSITRRRALLGAAGLLGSLAGCNDDVADADDSTDSPTAPRRGLKHVERDPEYVVFRASEDLDRGIVWFLRPDEVTTDGTVEPHERERTGFIASRATADRLRFADVDPVSLPPPQRGTGTVADSTDDVRAFVDATDFDTETLYLEQMPVDECRRRLLCYLTWSESELETRYGEFLRPHDVACETGVQDSHATLVRIPAALDPETVEHGGTGVSRGDCFVPPGERGRPAPRSPTDGTPSSGTPSESGEAATPTETDGGDA